jgi:hypothetical protein
MVPAQTGDSCLPGSEDEKGSPYPSSSGVSGVSTPEEKPQEQKQKLSPKGLKELWNEIVQKPKVLMLSQGRERRLRLRLREHPDVSWWEEVLHKIVASPFLRGAGNRGWQADFDWLIANDTNALKVLEGKYDKRPPSTIRERAEDFAASARRFEEAKRRGKP